PVLRCCAPLFPSTTLFRSRWWKRARTRVHRSAGTNHPVTPGGAVDEIDLVDQARREWHAARALFENVTDPELIDHAIHRMTAARSEEHTSELQSRENLVCR